MKHKIPVKFNGQIIGHTYNRPDKNGLINITDIDKDIWNNIVLTHSKHIFISSRVKGTINAVGKVIKEEQMSYDIILNTVKHSFKK